MGVPTMRGLSVLVVSMVGASLVAAQAPGETSTAQEGQLLPGPFRVYAVTGQRPQHMHDFVTERGLKPTVAVFALQLPANPQDPLAVLLQKVNAAAVARAQSSFGAFAVFLTLNRDFYEDPDRDKRVAELDALAKQISLTQLPVGLAHPEALPVRQYGLITRDDPVAMIRRHLVTVLIYDKHRVQRRFTFTEDKPLTEQSIQEVFSAIEKLWADTKP